MTFESIEYHWAVRGYHVVYNMFTIKTCLTDENGKEQIVGHLSLELFRFTEYLLDLAAIVTVKLTSIPYRRSVLVRGGHEIPCMVNPLQSGVAFLYPLKTSERSEGRFSDVFRGYIKAIAGCNGLKWKW